ncbi:MAG TPA: alpha-D-ribose 1-methylphosphonate 5-triphosphate diphosphatase, partial [Clostridia bacterium]
IDNINSFKKSLSMINHKIHLRYEVTYLDGADILLGLIRSNSIDLMSYMDHTPGQGQFKDDEAYKRFTIKTYGRVDSDFDTYLKNATELRSRIDWSKLGHIAAEAKENSIALASHDDDNCCKIDTLINCSGSISEFPINIETAIYAKNKGIYVCVGAPNIIRGKSHSSNMRAIDAVRAGACDIICSDYIPGAMLPAALTVAKENGDLPGAVRMVTQNPAEALGLEDTGSIEEGKIADIILFDLCGGYPVIRKTIAGGRIVYQSDYTVMKGLVPC